MPSPDSVSHDAASRVRMSASSATAPLPRAQTPSGLTSSSSSRVPMLDCEAGDAEDRPPPPRPRRPAPGRGSLRAPERTGVPTRPRGPRPRTPAAAGWRCPRPARRASPPSPTVSSRPSWGSRCSPTISSATDVRCEALDEHPVAASTAATAAVVAIANTVTAQRQQLARRFADLAGLAQPQHHRPALGLVRDAQRLHRDGAAKRGGDGHRLVLVARHRARRNHDAECGEPRLGRRLVEQHRCARQTLIGEKRSAGLMPNLRSSCDGPGRHSSARGGSPVRQRRQTLIGEKRSAGLMPGLRITV